MKKLIAISSVLLGVVFLAGCGQQPVSQTQPKTPAPATQPATTNQPVATKPAPITPNNAVSVAKDCGSVENTHIFVSPQDTTQQEKDALTCINQAFVSCNPSSVTLSGNGGGKYEIQGKEGQNCIIVQTMASQQSSKKCKIPTDFITASSDAAKAKNQSDKLFVLTVPFAFSMGKATNTQTGQVVTFECN
jgi:hypothetical protein